MYRLASRLSALIEGPGVRLSRTRCVEYRYGRRLVDAFLWPQDVARSWATFRSEFGHLPRVFRPRTFNERLQRTKLFARKAHHPVLSDKVTVREFVAERIGAEILTKLYWVGTDVDDARKTKLPKKFVLKPNHCAGSVFIVEDVAHVDWAALRELGRKWLSLDYSAVNREWQYRWIRRRLFVEEFLEGPDGRAANDYKFFCFDGKVKLVQVDVDRFGNRARAFFDRDFCRRLPFRRGQPQHEGTLNKPACFEEMREIAEGLSEGQEFLRVDLYDVGRPKFGELTLLPHAGFGDYDPPEWDARLGALWRRNAEESF